MKAAAVKTFKPALLCAVRSLLSLFGFLLTAKITAIACALVIITCAPDNASAMPWSWDMFNQANHRAQKESAPPMPEGTVPFAGITGKPLPLGTKTDANNIPNPVFPTEQSIERGKEVFDIYCAICHGAMGRGDGGVGKKYMSPADLTSDYVQKLPDGSIYFTITRGGVAKDDNMPGHGDAISPEDRWNVVNYVKHVINWN